MRNGKVADFRYRLLPVFANLLPADPAMSALITKVRMAEKGAEIAFSPGFRWGTTILPGEAITMETLLTQTAITYPAVTLNDMTGEQIKTVLEDVCDNLFNVDPYHQQGGDMVRVGGMSFTCDPTETMGRRLRGGARFRRRADLGSRGALHPRAKGGQGGSTRIAETAQRRG